MASLGSILYRDSFLPSGCGMWTLWDTYFLNLPSYSTTAPKGEL